MQDPAGLYVTMQEWFDPQALIRTVGFGNREVETIALDWLAKAGKRWRPFLTACIYGALRPQDDAEQIRHLSVAVECIHKGSLIYDDIQDGDDQRYGEPTVHAIHGMPLALTASLLLIGHGYRMIGDSPFSKEKCNAMLYCATKGHCDLCLGQGSELAWMRAPRPLSPAEVLEIFRLKTAPSFDVVFRLPLIAGDADAALMETLQNFSNILGTAYQIQDDLDDYHGAGDVDDIARARPNLILALAHESANAEDRRTIETHWCKGSGALLQEVKRILRDTEAAQKTRKILDEHKKQAAEILKGIEHQNLRTVLSRTLAMVFPGL